MNQSLLYLLLLGGGVYFLTQMGGNKPGTSAAKRAETYQKKAQEHSERADRYKKLASKLSEISQAKETIKKLETEAKQM